MTGRWGVRWAVAIGALVVATACGQPQGPKPPAPDPSAAPAPAADASAPAPPTIADRLGGFAFSSLIETARVPITPGGSIGISANVCGGCHRDIHAEWQGSTHAAAMRDPQYLAELAKPGNPRWLCLNCHAPLQAQRAIRIQPDTALDGASPTRVGTPVPVPNPRFDASLVHEAITCATCHVRVAPDGRGTIIGTRGDTLAPHRVTVSRPSLRGVCERCHTPGQGQLTPDFPCWFDTHTELAEGPVRDTDCVDCHMPSITRPLAVGAPPRATRRHLWTGSGIPKDFKGFDNVIARGWHPGVTVTAAGPKRTKAGWQVPLTLTNDQAGHAVPTGDPERHLRVHARLEGADGRALTRWSARLGQVWDWGDPSVGRPAKRKSDSRLRPGEARALTAELAAAPEATHLVVEVLHVRLSPENLRHARNAVLDAELQAHRPHAQAIVAALEQHYPAFTYAYSARWPLAGGPAEVAPPATLVARAAAAQRWTVDQLSAVLEGAPPPR